MTIESHKYKIEDETELIEAFLSLSKRTVLKDAEKLLQEDESTRRMQNLCEECRFRNWYLDIDASQGGERPKVVLNPNENASGVLWKVTIVFRHPWPPSQMCTIQNLAPQYMNWYLDFDVDTEEVYLSEDRHSGTTWQLLYNQPIFGIRNLVALSKGLPYWLDINGNTGDVILVKKDEAGSGSIWQWRYE